MLGGKANSKIGAEGGVSVESGFPADGNSATVKPGGYFKLQVVGPDGVEKQNTGWIKNNFVNTGKAYCATKTSGETAPAAMDYLEVGSSSQAVNDTDTKCITYIDNTNGVGRAQGTATVETTTTTDDTSKVTYSWTSITGTENIEEIACFNGATPDGNTAIGRALTGAVQVNSGDTLNGWFKVIFA